MNLKHRLRQIETDECRRHRAISVMRVTYPSCGSSVPKNGGTSISSQQRGRLFLTGRAGRYS
jgi:hypothetical protein